MWLILHVHAFMCVSLTNFIFHVFCFRFCLVFTVFLATLSLFLATLEAARYLHNDFLTKVIRARPCFFDVTPIGRLINRFSNDVNEIDNDFPATLRAFASCIFSVSTPKKPNTKKTSTKFHSSSTFIHTNLIKKTLLSCIGWNIFPLHIPKGLFWSTFLPLHPIFNHSKFKWVFGKPIFTIFKRSSHYLCLYLTIKTVNLLHFFRYQSHWSPFFLISTYLLIPTPCSILSIKKPNLKSIPV